MTLSLSRKTWATLVGILLLAVVSSGVALLSAWRSEQVFRRLIARNLEQVRAIYELEVALLEQGAFTSLYLMGGDSERLAEARRGKPEFNRGLSEARTMGLELDEQQLIGQIAEAFAAYEVRSKKVIALYTAGDREQAQSLWLAEALHDYDQVYDLCEKLTYANARNIEQAIKARAIQTKRVNVWVAVFLSVLAGLIAGLSLTLSRGVFRPLRRLVDSFAPVNGVERLDSSSGEIASLGLYIDNLRDEVTEMRSQLSLSQRRLLDAEKLASIGELAASVAHEIRSPLTSLRLRVFSVQKAMAESNRQRDFELISEEITRLDNIVRSFLEFPGPQKLVLQTCSISLLLDKTLELLSYKLEATNVRVEREYEAILPQVLADPQQLKHAFANVAPEGVVGIYASTEGGQAIFRSVKVVSLEVPIVDFDGNGQVDIKDLLKMIGCWGQDEPLVDLSGDGTVDKKDLEILMSYWGQELEDPTLIAHWALDEAEGIVAYTCAGTCDGTLVGDPVWQPDGGQVDGALEFDGIDDSVTADFVLNPSDGPFSALAWVKDGAPGQAVVSQITGVNWLGADPTDGFLMTELKSGGRFVGVLCSEAVITDGDWHRIGFTWDGSTRSLYVDDVLVAEDTQSGLAEGYGGLNIGCGANMTAGTFVSGLIDDVRLYNRAVKP